MQIMIMNIFMGLWLSWAMWWRETVFSKMLPPPPSLRQTLALVSAHVLSSLTQRSFSSGLLSDRKEDWIAAARDCQSVGSYGDTAARGRIAWQQRPDESEADCKADDHCNVRWHSQDTQLRQLRRWTEIHRRWLARFHIERKKIHLTAVGYVWVKAVHDEGGQKTSFLYMFVTSLLQSVG